MIPSLLRVKEILDRVDSQDFSSTFILDMNRLLKDKVDAHHQNTDELPIFQQNSQAQQAFFDCFSRLKNLFNYVSRKFEAYEEKVRNDWLSANPIGQIVSQSM